MRKGLLMKLERNSKIKKVKTNQVLYLLQRVGRLDSYYVRNGKPYSG